MTLTDSFPFCEELGLVSVIHMTLKTLFPFPQELGLVSALLHVQKFPWNHTIPETILHDLSQKLTTLVHQLKGSTLIPCKAESGCFKWSLAWCGSSHSYSRQSVNHKAISELQVIPKSWQWEEPNSWSYTSKKLMLSSKLFKRYYSSFT